MHFIHEIIWFECFLHKTFVVFQKIQFSRISIDRVWFLINRKFSSFWILLLPDSIGIRSIEILEIWIFEKLQKIMQKQLNPSDFMNEMHENEFKCFSKTWFFNPKLQNKIFKLLPQNFQPLNMFCIKIIEYIILDG